MQSILNYAFYIFRSFTTSSPRLNTDLSLFQRINLLKIFGTNNILGYIFGNILLWIFKLALDSHGSKLDHICATDNRTFIDVHIIYYSDVLSTPTTHTLKSPTPPLQPVYSSSPQSHRTIISHGAHVVPTSLSVLVWEAFVPGSSCPMTQ